MDELISKQAAIEAINLWLYCDKDERMPADVIKALPPVQPEITHEQAIDYLHKTGWLQNHDRILTESKMMMPVQPIIYCKNCLYKKICSWKNQGAEFCSFGERGKQDDSD